MNKIGVTFLTACLGGAVAIGSYKLIESKLQDGSSFEDKQKVYFTNNPSPTINSSSGELDFTQAAASVTPAVVHIKTTYNNDSGEGNSGRDKQMQDLFEDFFGGRRRSQGPAQGSGSGVIISDDGYIVTNNHVVDNADKIDVILPDKRSLVAKVIGRDANTDLALLKIEGSGFPIVKLGNSDNVRVGEWVLAVGYPFALNTTVTAGIVSAKGRQIGILDQGNNQSTDGEPQARTAIESFIQTDAAINRGNSGGALVNTKGELIGVNAAIASQSGSYEGYGFAIPINLAKKVLNDFKEFGSVRRGYIGVNFTGLDAEQSKRLGVSEINGLYINEVIPGSGAAQSGLKEGDIITKVDGNQIFSPSDLQERIGRLGPGDKVQLSYLRAGKLLVTNVTLKGEESVRTANNSTNSAVTKNLGASFAPASDVLKKKYKISSGVVVSNVKPGGFFDQLDVVQGTIITSINGRPITNADDIETAISSGRNNMATVNAISPDGMQIRYQFQVR
ncbi:Do/DeqQ family serine protease [Daejeonella rubra]|uniref:Do/DeqQ family serine protease n=1 Tax=Daejeonella rubra TaxID=990371 RepID=A0A1G9YI66_9SPHI|nr:Do family serine endopeptidase [Daejeonella rubra]SDN08143.1 Do/DeqQ family serine protease [Daejeonella rubra]